MTRLRRFVLAALAGTTAVSAAAAQSVADVFDRVKGSVVVVRTVSREPVTASSEAAALGGLGSGVLVAAEGRVLTAAHVVQVAESIEVEFASGERLRARVLASEPAADVALLTLEAAPARAVVAPIGDSDKTRIGDQVLVIGAPLGVSYTLSVGHVSARREADSLYGGLASGELLQTDAPIHQGNSGGPMFNLQGEVIGIVSHVITRTGVGPGLGFAVASNTARDLVLSGQRNWSGIDGLLLHDDLARVFNLPQEAGVLVQRVAANSPAARLGILGGSVLATIEGEEILLGGDVLLEVDGISIADPEGRKRVREVLSRRVPGQTLKVTVLRGGRRVDLSGVPTPR